MSVSLVSHHRFIAHVALAFGDACWNWCGSKNDRGYGLFYINGRRVRAHREAWRLALGSIPDGLSVCHRCDNPSCVRPAHLFLGTQADNMRDMWNKGRGLLQTRPSVIPRGEQHKFRKDPELGKQTAATMRANGGVARGERHGSAKLTESDVRAIRQAYRLKEMTPTQLGRQYGISRGMAWQIGTGRSWAHLTDESAGES